MMVCMAASIPPLIPTKESKSESNKGQSEKPIQVRTKMTINKPIDENDNILSSSDSVFERVSDSEINTGKGIIPEPEIEQKRPVKVIIRRESQRIIRFGSAGDGLFRPRERSRESHENKPHQTLSRSRSSSAVLKDSKLHSVEFGSLSTLRTDENGKSGSRYSESPVDKHDKWRRSKSLSVLCGTNQQKTSNDPGKTNQPNVAKSDRPQRTMIKGSTDYQGSESYKLESDRNQNPSNYFTKDGSCIKFTQSIDDRNLSSSTPHSLTAAYQRSDPGVNKTDAEKLRESAKRRAKGAEISHGAKLLSSELAAVSQELRSNSFGAKTYSRRNWKHSVRSKSDIGHLRPPSEEITQSKTESQVGLNSAVKVREQIHVDSARKSQIHEDSAKRNLIDLDSRNNQTNLNSSKQNQIDLDGARRNQTKLDSANKNQQDEVCRGSAKADSVGPKSILKRTGRAKSNGAELVSDSLKSGRSEPDCLKAAQLLADELNAVARHAQSDSAHIRSSQSHSDRARSDLVSNIHSDRSRSDLNAVDRLKKGVQIGLKENRTFSDSSVLERKSSTSSNRRFRVLSAQSDKDLRGKIKLNKEEARLCIQEKIFTMTQKEDKLRAKRSSHAMVIGTKTDKKHTTRVISPRDPLKLSGATGRRPVTRHGAFRVAASKRAHTAVARAKHNRSSSEGDKFQKLLAAMLTEDESRTSTSSDSVDGGNESISSKSTDNSSSSQTDNSVCQLVLRQCRIGESVAFGLVGVQVASQPNGNGYPDGHGLVTIKMIPDSQGRFGFNVKGGADQGMPIIVSRVAPQTPADNAIPRLNEGDQVLYINGRDVSQHTHEQVVMFIRASREKHSGQLELIVRPNVYVGEETVEEPDFVYNPETHQISSSASGANALDLSLTLLQESLESGAALAQFEQLYRKKPGMTMNAARLENNIPKNRYRDISPYDQTRVILKNGSMGDYINANYVNMEIPGSGIVNRYIAAQGPLPTTCVDFWQMVWEQQSTLVVMLTTKVEKGRVKCHQYWPDLYETSDFGALQITCVKEEEEETASFAFREFNLTHVETSEERHISHMQYIAWPDHGVPDDPADFLEFVVKVRQKRTGVEPTIVHCSAGIGRTGVLITMETAMCLIEANQPVYPLSIVRQMRDQRAMLIQTASQYKFVCEAILRVYGEGIVKPLEDYQR